MKLYDTDYLLRNANNEFVKDINGNYVIYSDSARDEEIFHAGDKWIKTTDLSKSVQKKLLKQIQPRKEYK
jgi:hypothetical protein